MLLENLGTFALPVLLLVAMYFFMIRPENKKRKEANAMRDALSVGDEITTIGGMVGKIVQVKDNLVTFETGEDRVRIQILKNAIADRGKDKASDSK